MGEIVYEDVDIVRKAFHVLEKEMSLVEYTRFLQLIGPSKGDATKELMEKRKGVDVNRAYKLFLKRIRTRKSSLTKESISSQPA